MYKETEGKLGTAPTRVRNELEKPPDDKTEEVPKKREKSSEKERKRHSRSQDKEKKGSAQLVFAISFATQLIPICFYLP